MVFHDRRGVTLLEMIIVIVILAIGAAAAMPILNRGTENEKMKGVQGSVRLLRNAVMTYARDHDGKLPVVTGTPHDFTNLFDSRVLLPDDLAYRQKGADDNAVLNYFVAPGSATDIDPLPTGANALLFLVKGSFSSGSLGSRFYYISQCRDGAKEGECRSSTCSPAAC